MCLPGSMEKPDDEPKARFQWQQLMAATLATLSAMCVGTALGWTAPVLPILQNATSGEVNADTPTEPLTDGQAAWIGALLPLGALVGSVPSGFLTHRFGRKRLLLILGAVLLMGWVLLLFHETVELLYVGRLVSGVAAGGVTTVAPLYCEEVAAANVRGALGTLLDLMLALGLLVVYALGAMLPVRYLTATCAALPVLFCATFALMPESPVFLRMRGSNSEAQKALAWLKVPSAPAIPLITLSPVTADSTEQCSQIRNHPPELLPVLTSISSPKLSIKDDLQKSETHRKKPTPTLRACTLVFCLMAYQQLSGVDAILFYTVDIYQKAASSFRPEIATVLTGVIQLVATGMSSLLVEHIGRRRLLLTSGVAMAVAHGVLAAQQAWPEMQAAAGWVPLLAINLFLVGFSLGLGPLPWLLIAELLPAADKRWAAGAATAVSWAVSVVMTGGFTEVMLQLGTAATYATLCAVCVSFTLFSVLLVPETRGRTSDQIQDDLLAAGPLPCCRPCASTSLDQL